MLESNFSEYGYKAPSARKTGTTIAGLVYKVSSTPPSGENSNQRCPVGNLQVPLWPEGLEKVQPTRKRNLSPFSSCSSCYESPERDLDS